MTVGVLLPAPLGVLALMTLTVPLSRSGLDFTESRDLFGLFWAFVGVSLVAYLLVGVQSILFAVLVEHVINRRVRSNALALFLSALLGACTPISVLLFFPKWEWAFIVFIAIGAIVGLAVGYLLRRMYKKWIVVNAGTAAPL